MRRLHTISLCALLVALLCATSGRAAPAQSSCSQPACVYHPVFIQPTTTQITTSTMATRRTGHTATLLPNGKVLVIGGWAATTRLMSAEIYDPTTNTWSAAKSMSTPRADHEALLLPNGHVLAIGGYNLTYNDEQDNAEVYNPITDTWTPAGHPAAIRQIISALLLPNGKVVVSGFVTYLPSDPDKYAIEIYDPGTNLWSATNSQPPIPPQQAMVLPNGAVLYCGNEANLLRVCARYDSSADTWGASQQAANDANGSLTRLQDGRILAVGGTIGPGIPIANNEVQMYDPGMGEWHEVSRIPGNYEYGLGRNRHTAILLDDGQVMIAGGLADTSEDGWPYPVRVTLANVSVYDPAVDQWWLARSLLTARSDHTATLLSDGSMLVVGGTDANGHILASAERYPTVGSVLGTQIYVPLMRYSPQMAAQGIAAP